LKSKTTKNHTTYIKTAEKLLKELNKMSEVEKISLGFIKRTPNKKGKVGLKVKEISGGLHLKVRGNTSIQDIYVYTKDTEIVSKVLENINL